MTLKETIKSDVIDVFLNNDEFAEEINYIFEDGGSRTILAIVDRQPVEIYVEGVWILPAFMIIIHNNCTTGVNKAKVDTGGDHVELQAETGDLTKTRVSVLRVLSRDIGGTIQLALK